MEDDIGEKVKVDLRTFKVNVDGKTTVNVSVWTGGNQESCLIHIIGALNYCNRTKLFVKWKAAKTKRDGLQADLRESYDYICMLQDIQDDTSPMQEREKVPEAQETSPKRTLAGSTASRKKNKEGRTNTPVPTEEAPIPEVEELNRAKVAYK